MTDEQYKVINDYVEVKDCKGAMFYVSLCDIDLIKNYTWYVANSGYVERKDWLKGANKTVRLHRQVMQLQRGVGYVDHANKLKYDNRRENLRLATRAENSINRLPPANNTSGFTGVVWDKSRNKWAAQITVKRKVIHIGRFHSKEDAIIARKSAEEKYYGQYAPLRNGVDYIEQRAVSV